MFADLGHFTAFSIRVKFQPGHYFVLRNKIFWIDYENGLFGILTTGRRPTISFTGVSPN